MGSKTLTISMPEEMLAFLEDNPLLSPSKIFQVALTNVIENHKIARQTEEQLRRKIAALEKHIQSLQGDENGSGV